MENCGAELYFEGTYMRSEENVEERMSRHRQISLEDCGKM